VGEPDGGEPSMPSGAGRGDERQNGHRVLVSLAAAEPAAAGGMNQPPPRQPEPAHRAATKVAAKAAGEAAGRAIARPAEETAETKRDLPAAPRSRRRKGKAEAKGKGEKGKKSRRPSGARIKGGRAERTAEAV
jgi:hypothetical protein